MVLSRLALGFTHLHLLVLLPPVALFSARLPKCWPGGRSPSMFKFFPWQAQEKPRGRLTVFLPLAHPELVTVSASGLSSENSTWHRLGAQ